jgi:hypothetical protein
MHKLKRKFEEEAQKIYLKESLKSIRMQGFILKKKTAVQMIQTMIQAVLQTIQIVIQMIQAVIPIVQTMLIPIVQIMIIQMIQIIIILLIILHMDFPMS